MAVSLRKNIAKKVSSVDAPEIYNWSKWLKTPLVKQHTVEVFKKTKLPDSSKYNTWIDFPLFTEYKFLFEKLKLSKKLKKLQLTEPKTSFVFFGISAPRSKKIDIPLDAFVSIVHPSFMLKKLQVKYSHSETEWIRNLKISQFEFQFSKPDQMDGMKFLVESIPGIKETGRKEQQPETIDIIIPESETEIINGFITEEETSTSNITFSKGKTETDKVAFREEKTVIKKCRLDYLSGLSNDANVEFSITGSEVFVIPCLSEETACRKIDLGSEFVIPAAYSFQITVIKPDFVGFEITPPVVKDCISEMVPEIYDIDILSAAKFSNREFCLEKIINIPDILFFPSDTVSYELSPQPEIFSYGLFISTIPPVINNDISFTSAPLLNTEYFIIDAVQTTAVELPGLLVKCETQSITFSGNQAESITDSVAVSYMQPVGETENIAIPGIETEAGLQNIEVSKIEVKKIQKGQFNFSKTVIKKGNINLLKIEAPPLPRDNKETKETVQLIVKPGTEIRKDFWIGLDEEQLHEYENTLSKELHQIEDLVDSGNIFRFQAKVFFLLHQLKQICNFASTKTESLKSDFLISQLEIIFKEGKKAIVFSQYDKHGTQKLEQIFKQKGIKYYSFLSSQTPQQAERNLQEFKTSKTPALMLASSKAATQHKYFGEVSYIIHFDQWWLPVTQWAIEERAFNLDDKNFKTSQRLNVFSYNSKILIEKRIFDKLKANDLLTKSIFETVPSEIINRMISDEDWMKILGIEIKTKKVIKNDENEKEGQKVIVPEFPKENPLIKNIKILRGMKTREICDKICELFLKLNYKEIKSEISEATGKVIVKATAHIKEKKSAVIARCFTDEKVEVKELQFFIDSSLKENYGKIYIIVTGNLSTRINTDNLNDTVILLTVDKLAVILHNLDLI